MRSRPCTQGESGRETPGPLAWRHGSLGPPQWSQRDGATSSRGRVWVHRGQGGQYKGPLRLMRPVPTAQQAAKETTGAAPLAVQQRRTCPQHAP
eukprot:1387097-Pyramimonas_sp.AAC.1